MEQQEQVSNNDIILLIAEREVDRICVSLANLVLISEKWDVMKDNKDDLEMLIGVIGRIDERIQSLYKSPELKLSDSFIAKEDVDAEDSENEKGYENGIL